MPPIHLSFRTDADELMDESFERDEQPIKDSVPPLENLFQISADRFNEQGDDEEKRRNLKGIGRAHFVATYEVTPPRQLTNSFQVAWH